MPFYEIPHSGGERIWLRRSKRLQPVRDRKREAPEPTPRPEPEPRPEVTAWWPQESEPEDWS